MKRDGEQRGKAVERRRKEEERERRVEERRREKMEMRIRLKAERKGKGKEVLLENESDSDFEMMIQGIIRGNGDEMVEQDEGLLLSDESDKGLESGSSSESEPESEHDSHSDSHSDSSIDYPTTTFIDPTKIPFIDPTTNLNSSSRNVHDVDEISELPVSVKRKKGEVSYRRVSGRSIVADY